MWSAVPQRRRRLQEHDDLRLPSALVPESHGMLDDRQHRRVVLRELGRPDERHLDAERDALRRRSAPSRSTGPFGRSRPTRRRPAPRIRAAYGRAEAVCSCRGFPSTLRGRERAQERGSSSRMRCVLQQSHFAQKLTHRFLRRKRRGIGPRRPRDVAHVQVIGSIIGSNDVEPCPFQIRSGMLPLSGNTDGRS